MTLLDYTKTKLIINQNGQPYLGKYIDCSLFIVNCFRRGRCQLINLRCCFVFQ